MGEAVVPKRLPLTADTLALAADLIARFRAAEGRTRAELEAELQVLEGDQTDYRLKRGLAHLLASAYSTFERCAPIDPAVLRQRVFAPVRTVYPVGLKISGVSTPLKFLRLSVYCTD
jgi:predicted nuclease of restriction endonuclease-like RecB superfamily